jgi:hypothetical protein
VLWGFGVIARLPRLARLQPHPNQSYTAGIAGTVARWHGQSDGKVGAYRSGDGLARSEMSERLVQVFM